MKKEDCGLPDPSGLVSKKVPATSIKKVNKEVNVHLSGKSNGKCCAPYVIVTPEQKARIGKYTAENAHNRSPCRCLDTWETHASNCPCWFPF